MSHPNIEQMQAELRELLENARDALQRYDINAALLTTVQIGEFFNKQFPSGVNFQELFFTPEDKLKGDAKAHRELYKQLTSGIDVGLTDTLTTLRGFIMDNVTTIAQQQQTDKALGKTVSPTNEATMVSMLRGIWVLSDITDKQPRVTNLPSDGSPEMDAKGKFVKQVIEKITHVKEAIDKVYDNPNITDKKSATQSLKFALEQYQASLQMLVEQTVAKEVIPITARVKQLEKVSHETREEAKGLPEKEKSAQLEIADQIQKDISQNRRKAVSFGKSPLPVIGKRSSNDGEKQIHNVEEHASAKSRLGR